MPTKILLRSLNLKNKLRVNFLYWLDSRYSFFKSSSSCNYTMTEVHESLNWCYSVEDIATKTDKLINETKSIYDDISAIPLSKVTFDNVIKRIGDVDSSYATIRYATYRYI